MPTRRLPDKANLNHLKNQAKDLLAGQKQADTQTLQRIREFLPRLNHASDAEIANAKITLTEAQLTIAREYGYPSWARLKKQVDQPEDIDLPMHERIEDPVFRRAVDLLDNGDLEGLRAHLRTHPNLVHQHVVFEGGNYFQKPTLLEFVAENPVRHDRLPPNIVEIARLILDSGAKENLPALNYALGLVCSGRVPREHHVQVPLIDLFVSYGADPSGEPSAALAHGEFEAVDALLRNGAKLNLPTAAALGKLEEARAQLQGASPEDRHLALALAAQHGHEEAVRLLLDAGENPSRYNPMGTHSHSTPLHQAVWRDSLPVVRLLVERGADLNLRDTAFQATPLGWAKYGDRKEIARYLEEQGATE